MLFSLKQGLCKAPFLRVVPSTMWPANGGNRSFLHLRCGDLTVGKPPSATTNRSTRSALCGHSTLPARAAEAAARAYLSVTRALAPADVPCIMFYARPRIPWDASASGLPVAYRIHFEPLESSGTKFAIIDLGQIGGASCRVEHRLRLRSATKNGVFWKQQLRRHKAARSLSDRCRILLKCADCLTNNEIVAELGG